MDHPAYTYTYNDRDQLKSVTVNGVTVTYKYNGDGLLVERSENGKLTRYYYDGDQIIAEAEVVNGTATLKARYIRGIGLIARESSTSEKSYYLHNGHGDIVELRDDTGQTRLNRYQYDIWGKPVLKEETIENPFLYSGELWDSTTNLQYLRARWYDPGFGRFISEDTYEGDITNPLSLNLYTYVNNNPLRYIDPTGHIPSPYEAAEMAAHIYELKGSLSGGWTYSYTITGGDNMVMGVYYRSLEDGTVEYALVNKGSDLNWSDWKNNILQPVGLSADMKASIEKSTEFVNEHKDSEITMIGHSKGGAEATANAVANNKNAITFNTARAILRAYGLSAKDYTGTMTHYVVKGELLNHIVGEPSVGSVIYLPQTHKIKWWHADWYVLYQRYKNHSMDSVKEALKAGGYN